MMKKLLIFILPCITIAFSICILHLSNSGTLTDSYINLDQIQEEQLSVTETSCITADGKININVAPAEVLTHLNGIGEVLAQRIVEYREAAGSFQSIDDLINVKGIGSAKLEKIRNYISLG